MGVNVILPTGTTITYDIRVDWNNDGDFIDANEDISADVKGFSWERGKDEKLPFDLVKANTGMCNLTVFNDNKKYTPSYSGGVLYGNLLPRRAVRVQITMGGLTYNSFYGYIEKIIPYPRAAERYATIFCVDGMDYLNLQAALCGLQENQYTGVLIGSLLDAAAWPAAKRTIDTGISLITLWFSEGTAIGEIRKLEDTELGFFYVDGSGNAIWEDRHHRLKTDHLISQATFANVMADVPYEYGARSIYNRVKAEMIPHTLQVLAEIWQLVDVAAGETQAGVPQLGTGEAKTFYAEYANFAREVVSPAATTDYLANTAADGSGTNMTASISVAFTSYSNGAKLVVTNNAAVLVYVTFLRIRGKVYLDGEPIKAFAEDAISQGKYQLREVVLPGQFISDINEADSLCKYALSLRKDPQPEFEIKLIGSTDALVTQILARAISDRVTITCDELGISAKDYSINKIAVEVRDGGKSIGATWTLAEASYEEYWVLGTSALGTGTKLGY